MALIVAKEGVLLAAKTLLRTKKAYDIYKGVRFISNYAWSYYSPKDEDQTNENQTNEDDDETIELAGKCSICKNELKFENEDELNKSCLEMAVVKLQQCEHEFHFKCIVNYVDENGRKCKICKIEI